MAGSVPSSSKNVSNSGQMSNNSAVTGATGGQSNVTNITSSNGAPGKNGSPSTVTINGRGSSSISPPVGPYSVPPIPGVSPGKGGSIIIDPAMGATHPMPATGQLDQARSAYAQVEGHLAQARQQALAQARFAGQPIQDQVNSAFDTATNSLANQRKSAGY